MSIVLPITPSTMCVGAIINNSAIAQETNSEKVIKGKTEKELVKSGIPQGIIDEWKENNK